MNMIVCGENCKHQKDGYCCLTGESRITGAIKSPCWYYDGTANDTGGKNTGVKRTYDDKTKRYI